MTQDLELDVQMTGRGHEDGGIRGPEPLPSFALLSQPTWGVFWSAVTVLRNIAEHAECLLCGGTLAPPPPRSWDYSEAESTA
ncbi:hypothetical protein Q7C36_013250 [Tachysurus vachellii]|uniref:Uncharacterized protein n=1 Tax=Tachysurus vachellii TaxID=175792 RepID=A0AA88MKY4_TACVA|nr:hypothetical protein Q7C36_013250 [Tachysurus vachellii]